MSILFTGSADKRGNVWGNVLGNVGTGELKWRSEKQTTESKVRKVAGVLDLGMGQALFGTIALIIEGWLIFKDRQ